MRQYNVFQPNNESFCCGPRAGRQCLYRGQRRHDERHDDRAALVLPRARTCPRCGHSLAPPPPTGAERKETRAGAVAAKIVAVLLVLYMLGVAGTFVYDHLL